MSGAAMLKHAAIEVTAVNFVIMFIKSKNLLCLQKLVFYDLFLHP